MLGLEGQQPTETERPADAVAGELAPAPRYRHTYEVALLCGASWARLDRFELEKDEWIMCMRVVRVRDDAFPSGKIFAQLLVVGTGYQVGEDAPSTGRILLFEAVDQAADEGEEEEEEEEEGEGEGEGGTGGGGSAGGGTRGGRGGAGGRKLRLVAAVEERGPVLAVGALQGMLLCGVGSRLMSFLYRDGQLTASGFLVCGFLVCRLSVLQHYVLCGDLYQGLQLVQWKAEKKAFAALSKQPFTASAYATDLLLDEPSLHLVLAEEGKRLRVFGYSRTQAEARSGVHLVPRAALHLGSQVSATAKVPLAARRSALLVVTADGGLGLLAPVGETPHRRLSFLAQKLLTAVPHAAGLHPRAFRAHRAGAASARELKFVADGVLLRRFAALDAAAQDKLAHQIGTTPAQLLADLAAVSGDVVRGVLG